MIQSIYELEELPKRGLRGLKLLLSWKGLCLRCQIFWEMLRIRAMKPFRYNPIMSLFANFNTIDYVPLHLFLSYNQKTLLEETKNTRLSDIKEGIKGKRKRFLITQGNRDSLLTKR